MPNHFHFLIKIKEEKAIFNDKNLSGINNPVKHGFVEDMIEYPWSSYLTTLTPKKQT